MKEEPSDFSLLVGLLERSIPYRNADAWPRA